MQNAAGAYRAIASGPCTPIGSAWPASGVESDPSDRALLLGGALRLSEALVQLGHAADRYRTTSSETERCQAFLPSRRADLIGQGGDPMVVKLWERERLMDARADMRVAEDRLLRAYEAVAAALAEVDSK